MFQLNSSYNPTGDQPEAIQSLQDGLNNIDEIVQKRKQDFPGINLENYLRNRISYNFDNAKKESMRLFLQQINC